MTSRDFCYWLQGYFELQGNANSLAKPQVEMVKRHLHMVFLHEIDPSFGGQRKQKKLNKAHGKKKEVSYCAPAKHIPDPLIRC